MYAANESRRHTLVRLHFSSDMLHLEMADVKNRNTAMLYPAIIIIIAGLYCWYIYIYVYPSQQIPWAGHQSITGQLLALPFTPI